MTLDGLEQVLRDKFPKSGKKNRKVNFVRYADDFIVTGVSKEILENEVKPVIEMFLAKRGLSLSKEKTKITHINEGFDFLGVNFRKYNGKLLLKPSKVNIKGVLNKIRKTVKDHKTSKQTKLIVSLNPIIRGWASYHRHNSSSKTFSYIGYIIFRMLWRWSKRRHSKKNIYWIKNKYFKVIGNQNWVFTDGDLKLFNCSDVKIRRYIKIKGKANPYDPKWEIYFEKRRGMKMARNIILNKRLKNLWWDQSGKCLICKTPITKETGWHIHHIVPKVKGGSDNKSNLVLLHPNCHNQVHSQNLTVVKPLSVKKRV